MIIQKELHIVTILRADLSSYDCSSFQRKNTEEWPLPERYMRQQINNEIK